MDVGDLDLTTAIDELLAEHPMVGLAVGVVRDGRLAWFRGHGVADVPTRRPVDVDTVFRVASITKTVTAVAIAQLWEQSRIDLDAPAAEYLRAYELVPAHPDHRPATIRHLLTHTAGLGELVHPWWVVRPDFGESVPAGQRLPSLAELYGGRLRLHCEPGRRFVYTNQGPATLGQIIEDVSGVALHEYVREHILGPLGMDDSDIVRSDRVRAGLATGYEIGGKGIRRVDERDMVTAGAASLYSTPADLARYAAALLAGGRGERGQVLRPGTVEAMFATQYRTDPRLPGVGLAFFRSDVGGHRVVGHQGTHPGFHSRMLLAPDDGVGVLALTNGARQPDLWLPTAVSRMLCRLLDVPAPGVRGDVPQRPDRWADVCGWYRLDAAPTDTRLRALLGLGVEISVSGGRLVARFLTPIPALARAMPLRPDDPDDPYSFLLDFGTGALDPMRVVLAQGPDGATDRLCLEVPLTLVRQPDATNPRGPLVMGVAGSVALSAVVAGTVASAAAVARRVGVASRVPSSRRAIDA